MEILEIYPDGINEEQKRFMKKPFDEMVDKRKSRKLILAGVYGTIDSDRFKTQFDSEEKQEVNGPYEKTFLPGKNKYVRDTIENRKLLSEKFGDSKMSHANIQTYLVIDAENKVWDPTFDFQWLYTNQPPLTPIDEILSL